MTFGWVLGELVRRTDPEHRQLDRFVQGELCAPLGIDSLFLGVPDGALERIATLQSEPSAPLPPDRAAIRERTVPPAVELTAETYNRTEVLQACIPATGLTANARSVARLFALLANGGELDGVQLLSEDRVRGFSQPRAHYDDVDLTSGRVMPVGARGYWIADTVAGKARPGFFCNVGAGGAVAWADLATGLAVAICHNRMFSSPAPGMHPFVPIGEAVRAVAAG
jgi:CubicO group peptidase (beta-lactamase class C family)